MPWAARMTLMFALLGILFQLYAFRRIVFSIEVLKGRSIKRVRYTAIGLAAAMFIHPLILIADHLFGRDSIYQSAGITYDILFTFPFWIGLVMVVQVSFIYIALDIIYILSRIVRRTGNILRRGRAWCVLIIAAAVILYAGFRVYSDTFGLRTRETTLKMAGLPEDLEGFRIVQISDLHVDSRTNHGKIDPYLRTINELNPDIVFFCGDTVTNGAAYIQQAGETLGAIRAKYGVYACIGDHDSWSGRALVVKTLEDNGINVVEDSSRVIRVGLSSLTVTGITNIYRKSASPVLLDGIEKTRANSNINILFTHQPSGWIVDYAQSKGYNLFLAGHTHGGQIVFPLPGVRLTGSIFETKYVSGFYSKGPMFVSINNGLGLTLAPIRYNAPAEVTLIVLRGE